MRTSIFIFSLIMFGFVFIIPVIDKNYNLEIFYWVVVLLFIFTCYKWLSLKDKIEEDNKKKKNTSNTTQEKTTLSYYDVKKMTNEIKSADKIIKLSAKALASENKLARRKSLLPCSVAEVREAIKIALKWTSNEEEKERLTILYTHIGSFVDDELADEINNIYNLIETKQIDINAPENEKEKELFNNFLSIAMSPKAIEEITGYKLSLENNNSQK